MEVVAKNNYFTPGSEGLLSPLKQFFQDKAVSEILINKPYEVFVERHGVMECHTIPTLDPMHLRRLFTFIANENGQCLSEEMPMLSGNLYDGSRVQLVIPPAARFHTLSIRRPSIKKMTLEEYKQSAFYDRARPFNLHADNQEHLSEEDLALASLHQKGRWGDFIALAVEAKKNIVISGQTSSGKTTYLNACIGNIPHHERIITLEDTYEVVIPHQNLVSLRAPKKGEGQVNGLSMQDLVQCSLRLRPDRLIMGEIRGAEVLDFISACSTGHEGSITSIHANNPRIAFMRMTQLYKRNNVPSMRDEDILRELHEVIDVIIQVARDPNERFADSIYYKHAHMNH
ncbi:P-type DNA transfer ATPase VirB11 [Legionella lytica]|uniref:Type IV secretion system protein n=1 Tax=Legionella lytica TaxID=96232 RepID=A0ABW8DF27_9GAMM